MRRWLAVVAALLLPSAALAVPFWGAKQSLPPGTPPSAIKPGQFVWDPSDAPEGPLAVIVSLTEQRAYVYRNGVLIGVSSVSTGRPGHVTPTGVFTVLQKDKDHDSSLYHDAAMPYTERLTWGGVALHAGGLPGYPSSHGCVHLPSEFAESLFAISSLGMTVVIADDHSAPRDVAHPGALAPIDPSSGEDDEDPPLPSGQMERWEPDKSPEGPVSVVIGRKDRRAVAMRNGIEIGRARIEVEDPEKAVGVHAFLVVEGGSAEAPRWVVIPSRKSGTDAALDPFTESRVTLPTEFLDELRPLLVPGTTLVVTDGAILPDSTGTKLDVLNNAERLSDASRRTLALQGGPLAEAEADAFEKGPLFSGLLRLRQWDERGKVPGLEIAPLESYRALLVERLRAVRDA
ncbi:MAG: L,D-transpeptidase [Deltaproteobacteria bacterium]|nr:L,D-transpeptidase [Deltaproteobacteria bacterium]